MTQQELLALIQQAKDEQWTTLDLTDNAIYQLPPEIGQLTALQELYLFNNRLNSLPPEFGQLTALQKLDSGNNQLIGLPPEFGQLTALQKLDLTNNQLVGLPPEIGQLTALQKLYLLNNRLSRLPPEIGQLTALQWLYLTNNQLGCLPPEIGQLTVLQLLDLDNNRLTGLPFEINSFKSCRTLTVRNNPGPFPPHIAKLKQQGTGVYIPEHSPMLPAEFLQKPSWEIYHYLQGGEGAMRPLNEAKLILVGDGAVGKTCLVNRLLHGTFIDQPKTEGIDRQQWQGLRINGHDIRLNVWDFGGQEVLHATHQFFLTKRSIYLLVLDARRGEQESRLEYWLKLIHSFGGDSPILIVTNKSVEEHRLSLNQRFLTEKYPGIKGFYATDCKDGTGIAKLKQGIQAKLAELPHIHDLMPETWFALKQNLERHPENYISYAAYQDLCTEHKITEQGSQSTLCGFLHDLGIVLNFRDDARLNDTHVLNPEWVTDAVYKLLNNLELFKNHGIFTLADLARMLDVRAYPSAKEHAFIIDMMQKFELCFPISDTQNYLLPELLQNEEPDLNWPKADSLRFEYHYDILPHSVFSRFVVRLHQYISQATYWRTGVVLTYENNKALVKADLEDRKIFVWVSGNPATRRVLLGIVRQNFDHIHRTIKGLDARECVSLPQKPEAIIEYTHLLKLEAKEITKYYFPEIDAEIDVQELLNGIEVPERREQQGGKTIFVLGDYNEEKKVAEINQHNEKNTKLTPQLTELYQVLGAIDETSESYKTFKPDTQEIEALKKFQSTIRCLKEAESRQYIGKVNYQELKDRDFYGLTNLAIVKGGLTFRGMEILNHPEKLIIYNHPQASIDMSTQNVNINNSTVHGSVLVAQTIKNCLNTIEKSKVDDAIKDLLKQLLNQIEDLNNKVPEQAKIIQQMSRDTETLVNEINSEQPRKRNSLFSLEGIKDTALQLGETAKPIVELAEKVSPYLQALVG